MDCKLTAVQTKALEQIRRAHRSVITPGGQWGGHSIACYFPSGGVAYIKPGTSKALRRRGLIDWTLEGDSLVVKAVG